MRRPPPLIGDSALATEPPGFFGGLSIFGPRFGAPLCDQLVRETAARRQVCEQTSHTLRGLPASFFFAADTFRRVDHAPHGIDRRNSPDTGSACACSLERWR